MTDDPPAGQPVQRGRRRRGGGRRLRRLRRTHRRPHGSALGVVDARSCSTSSSAAVTFSGSLIAAGKLQGIIPGRPITFPGARHPQRALVALAARSPRVLVVVRPDDTASSLLVLLAAALAFGVLMVLPIGGADAPVVVSLLNAFTGLAVAMAGFADRQPGAHHRRGPRRARPARILTLQMAASDEPLGAEHHARAASAPAMARVHDADPAASRPVSARSRADDVGAAARLRPARHDRARATGSPPRRRSTRSPSWRRS